MDYLAFAGAKMSFYTNLFTLCSRGFEETWCLQRIVVSNKKNFTLSSLGWSWI